MAFQVIDQNDPRFQRPTDVSLSPDMLTRQQIMHRRKVDEREQFIDVSVTISTGPKNTAADVVLSWPKTAEIIEHRDDLDNVVKRERVWSNGRFVFAVYAKNKDWHKASREEWEGAAKNALEKFCASNGSAITFGPRPEDTNRYNYMVELREAIPGGNE